MIELPLSISNILNGKEELNEKIIYKGKNFIVLEDKKHFSNSYHYTAWAIQDIHSLLEIDLNIINELKAIKEILIENKIISKSGKIFIHFPPNIWRLHIHFVAKNHKFLAKKEEVHFIETIEKNLLLNSNFYKKNCIIINSKL